MAALQAVRPRLRRPRLAIRRTPLLRPAAMAARPAQAVQPRAVSLARAAPEARPIQQRPFRSARGRPQLKPPPSAATAKAITSDSAAGTAARPVRTRQRRARRAPP